MTSHTGTFMASEPSGVCRVSGVLRFSSLVFHECIFGSLVVNSICESTLQKGTEASYEELWDEEPEIQIRGVA